MVNRQPQYYLITGLLLGLILGLLYSWQWISIDDFNAYPHTLEENYKDEYRILIAVSYVANGDMGRALSRLELLGDDNVVETLKALAQRTLAEIGDSEQARALALLSSHLEAFQDGTEIAPSAIIPNLNGNTQIAGAEVETNTPVATPGQNDSITETTTPIILPSSTIIPTPINDLALIGEDSICDSNLEFPVLKVFVTDSTNKGVPGVEIIVSWNDGNSQNNLHTGLKPDLGLGYADFELLPNIQYDVEIVGIPSSLVEIEAVDCEFGGEQYWTSIILYYSQP